MRLHFLTASIALAIVVSTAVARDGAKQALPDAWLADWQQPSAKCRPLQIVHGIVSPQAAAAGRQQIAPGIVPPRATPENMQHFADLGLGGIVCNLDFRQYMRSEEHWKTFVAGIDACRRLGMVVWLYDEDGYPSGAAGGLVLAENRALEATVLAFDASRSDPLFLRPAYEHTHASNNYSRTRRYINLLDDRAAACFLRKTHEAYWQRLQEHFGHTIEATFTDEPSSMAINVGQAPENIRRKVPVVDPVDPHVAPLPTVPWAYDLPDRYRERYGQDLIAQRRSLFAGSAAEDRQVRRQFWALVADLMADRYYGQIERWCAEHHVASSGHTLAEENILHHVPLDGNKLKVLGRMDIPGMDVLSSDPEAVLYSGWMTAAMPFSAAILHGRRRVMTEVSDFIQRSQQGPASLEAMRATAAWQAAWGATDFNLYYHPTDRPVDEYRAYCIFVGRLNAVLKPAQPAPEVLLYYPIDDLWAEYRPVAGPCELTSQSDSAQKIISSFMRLGETLQRNQLPFVLIDHEMLAAAKVDAPGKLTVGGHSFTTLVLPDGVELPPSATGMVDQFRQAGGRVLADREDARLAAAVLNDTIKPAYRLSPPCEKIALGRFMREGHSVLLLVNVGRGSYTGHLSVERKQAWVRLVPESGAMESVEVDSKGRLPLSLTGLQTILFVSSD